MKIYTLTGDQGTTSLVGNQRVQKCDLRICSYGTIDELNALLGLVRAEGLSPRLDEIVNLLQNQLFDLGAELASPNPTERSTDFLVESTITEQEKWIDTFEEELPALTNFILPGGSQSGALLHLARTVCRRAEREIVALSQTAPVREIVLKYVNRLSDLLFMMARVANAGMGVDDVLWKKPEKRKSPDS
ncbi:MAG: cob(I)yrinic acid a,c-diamide adenosyltransferase [Pirellulales bacterium]|mgnify:CR=1 FL=1|nr:cob(I)yrinic acid a,c-diamide adenosyltransferase [Pirellulales bacterium]